MISSGDLVRSNLISSGDLLRSNNHKNSLLNLCVTGSYTAPIFSTANRYPYLRQPAINTSTLILNYTVACTVLQTESNLFKRFCSNTHSITQNSTFLTSAKRTEIHRESFHCKEQVLCTQEQVSFGNITIRPVPTGSQKVKANCPLETRRIPVEVSS